MVPEKLPRLKKNRVEGRLYVTPAGNIRYWNGVKLCEYQKIPKNNSKKSGDELESVVLHYLLANRLQPVNSEHPTYKNLLTVPPLTLFSKQLDIPNIKSYDKFIVISSSGGNSTLSTNGNSDFILIGDSGELGISCKRNNLSMKSARVKSLSEYLPDKLRFETSYQALVSVFNSKYMGDNYRDIPETKNFITAVRDLIAVELRDITDFDKLIRFWTGANSRRNILVEVDGTKLTLYECVTGMMVTTPIITITSGYSLKLNFGAWGLKIRCHTAKSNVGGSNPIKMEVTPLDKAGFYHAI